MWIFISPCVLVMNIQNPIPRETCFIHYQHSAEKGGHLQNADTHNLVVVAEPVNAVCGTDTTAHHATPSPVFTGNQPPGY
jgi:hypothetical protein